MVNNNEIKYFLPGPNQDNDKRVSAEITKQLQKDFEGVLTEQDTLMGHFIAGKTR